MSFQENAGMKRIFAVVSPIVATSFLIQAMLAQAPATACGTDSRNYTFHTDSDISIPSPAEGMATLVLIADQLDDRPPGHAACVKCASQLTLGMDGQWIAATHGFSHTAISVPAGDHHFCVSNSPSFVAPDALPAMLGLHVEAGKTYFVRGRLARYYREGFAVLDLTQINEDEGRYLVSMSKRSLFTRKVTP
jgi:hypothetical protein